MRDMCDGAMHVVGNWGFGRKCVCGCEGGDGGVSCNLLRFGCRRVPTVLCLLCYGGTLAAWFSSLHPSGRSLECFLIDAGDPPTPGC